MRLFPPARLEYCVFIIVLWCALVTIVFILYGEDQVQSKTLQETTKCPVCFGDTSCFMLHSSNMHVVKLTGLSKVSLFNYINVKNVFYGKYKGSDIVLKKLAHDAEFRQFDQLVCNGSLRCQPRVHFYRGLLRTVFPELAADGSAALALAPDVSARFEREQLTCPSRRFLKFLYDAFSGQSELRFYHFATMLLVNAEPLMLQAFPQSHGWPFPRYLGACGRLVLEQYIGPTLARYHGASWRQRVELALQLLEIAEMLTSNDYDFNLYLTDVTAENLAVDSEGRVFIVDVEDVVVVDRQQLMRDQPPGWNRTHVAPILCADCMGYEADELCGHLVSDHNYFAMCKGLLAPDAFARGLPGGLLHSVPELVSSTHPELADWLRLCADPTATGGSRFGPAAELRHALNRALAEEGTD
ncbi:divergent protein kinase domain 2A-like [Pollicipes pollicipes]|uniref:divergent protein kinase domain 2A-like n=1 Tax=Pollicipes pollicipes TaxID=41117 RepID=UPI0018856B00|nr:divergent protein kinase domain 2A-like [Pollicipes pollicipes]XP_037075875.1 divergent protein kinase domain 2A-like [Pollicipes pollicipes]XP_037075876.1 divergent protein kinase domain 2A-like [Pollicipes pollicipes]